MSKLKTEKINKGIIIPLIPSSNEFWGYDRNAFGGVLNEKFEFVKLSQQIRYDDINEEKFSYWNIAPQNMIFDDIEYKDYDICYCGILHGAFGHILTECLSRLWFLLDNKDLKLAFLSVNSKKQNIIFEFLDCLNISPDRVEIITKPKQYRNVFVPEASFILNHSAQPEYFETINAVKQNIKPKKIEKLYLSRHYQDNGRAIGEENIEKIFNNNGFISFYPEKLPLKEQIAYIKGAKQFVATQGTSAHMSVFLNDNAEFTCLLRSTEPNRNQISIDNLKKYKTYYINCSLNFITLKIISKPCLLGYTEELEQYFINQHFNFKPFKTSGDDVALYIALTKEYSKFINKEDDAIFKNIQNVFAYKKCKIIFFIRTIIHYLLFKLFKLSEKKYNRYFNSSTIPKFSIVFCGIKIEFAINIKI